MTLDTATFVYGLAAFAAGRWLQMQRHPRLQPSSGLDLIVPIVLALGASFVAEQFGGAV